MCNFVPRECLAFGNLEEMVASVDGWAIPGHITPMPLLPEGTDIRGSNVSDFPDFGFLHVTNIPEGLEVLVISKLSAALQPLIENSQTVVELNYYLPLSSTVAEVNDAAFSPVAQRLISHLRKEWQSYDHMRDLQGKVGVLDSGLSIRGIRAPRQLITYDYSNPRQFLDVEPGLLADSSGHGTAVCRILDAILPSEVQLVSGRIATRETAVTVLHLARAYAHLVAQEYPDVMNLSLAPRDDVFMCPHCRKAVPVPAFHSLILPYVFDLAGNTTTTVMAAGNRGQACNARHYLGTSPHLVFASASASSGVPASYSNYVDGSACPTLTAFGGDPPDHELGQGIFSHDRTTFGTSFAAPFVSSAIFVGKVGRGMGQHSADLSTLMAYCSDTLGTELAFDPVLAETARVSQINWS